LIEQGYEKPTETIEVSVTMEADLVRWAGYLKRMTGKERSVMRGFLTREGRYSRF
jgi:hypothetical protein